MVAKTWQKFRTQSESCIEINIFDAFCIGTPSIVHEPVFRSIERANTGIGSERLSDKHVTRLVQKTAMARPASVATLPRVLTASPSGHFLPAGLATTAGVEGSPYQRQFGYASAEMTAATSADTTGPR